jgi:hypothetical protein
MKNRIQITFMDDIDFTKLDFNNARIKKDRQVFFDQDKKLVYKFFRPDWEFANNVERAFSLGYYNSSLVPNFHSLIKDNNNKNRGYITSVFIKEDSFEYYKIRKLNFAQKVINKIIAYNRLPRKMLNIQHLNKLLDQLIQNSTDYGVIFLATSLDHIWVSSDGYHIFDLESIRDIDWIIDINNNDQSAIRLQVNCYYFNYNLKELIEAHGLKFPFKIDNKKKLESFMKSYNKLNGFN